MPNFNDVYLDNYLVLDYGLICKNNPKWGLVSVASGSDAHLSRLSCHFLCHSDMFIKYGMLGSFLCQVMCCAQSLAHLPPSLLLPYHPNQQYNQHNNEHDNQHRTRAGTSESLACRACGWRGMWRSPLRHCRACARGNAGISPKVQLDQLNCHRLCCLWSQPLTMQVFINQLSKSKKMVAKRMAGVWQWLPADDSNAATATAMAMVVEADNE